MNKDKLRTILEERGRAELLERLAEAGSRSINLRGFDLRGVDLESTDLRGVDLFRADLRSTNLCGANLQGVVLANTDLDGADLRGANLSHAELTGAKLRCVDLRGANLQCAILRDTDFMGADMRDIDLRGSELKSARLYNTKIVTAQAGKHFAYYHEGYVRIGCVGMSLGEWLQGYERVGVQHGYLQSELKEHRVVLDFFRTIHEMRCGREASDVSGSG